VTATWERYQIVATTDHSTDERPAAHTSWESQWMSTLSLSACVVRPTTTQLVIPSELWPNYDDWMRPSTTPRWLCPHTYAVHTSNKQAWMSVRCVRSTVRSPWFGQRRPACPSDWPTGEISQTAYIGYIIIRVTVARLIHALHSGAALWSVQWTAASYSTATWPLNPFIQHTFVGKSSQNEKFQSNVLYHTLCFTCDI